MKEPRTVPWGLRISNDDFTKLKAGRERQNQNDKWRIWVPDQSDRSKISITITRVALNKDIFILHVKPGDGDAGSYIIEEFTWENDNDGFQVPEEQAKQQVVVLSRFLLKCDIEELPEYDRSSVWDYSATKKEDS
jgi:hypothetical protein